jgi:uncharacterized protein (TIGR02246 family)
MSPTATTFDFRTAIEATITKFEKAANARDAAAIAGMYAENATLLPPGSPAIKGRKNIQQFWQRFFEAGASDAKLRPTEVTSIGDVAYEIGSFEAKMPGPQGAPVRTEGKYVVLWKRLPDDSVNIIVDIFNTNA